MLRWRAAGKASSPSGEERRPPSPATTSTTTIIPYSSLYARDYRKIFAFGLLVLSVLVLLATYHDLDDDDDKVIKADDGDDAISLSGSPPAEMTRSQVMMKRGEVMVRDAEFVEQCPHFPAPGGLKQQKCCQLGSGASTGIFHCLPNLVIAGTQKSGTTALFSYLMMHPEILPGGKKEFHLFDFDKSFSQLREKLPQLLPRQTEEELPGFVVMDSTPTYIADSKACPRMAHLLSKDAVFVVLLRNPIDRLWSDVRMKKRRIDSQDEFKYKLVPRYRQELARCLGAYVFANLTAFRQCLPPPLAQHGRIAAFHKHFSQPKQRKTKFHYGFIQRCLTGTRQTALECMRSSTTGGDILRETMPVMPDVILEEMDRLEQDLLPYCCAGSGNVTTATATSLRTVKAKPAEFFAAMPRSAAERGCGLDCFPQARMMSDISKNFVWRSMYARQLQHCLGSIARERFLFVNADDLRQRPKETLRAVLEHASLDTSVDLGELTGEEIHDAFQARFPDFESMTGWARRQAAAEVDDEEEEDAEEEEAAPPELELPPKLRMRLQNFFRPHNRDLFDLLGVEPFSGWDV